VVCVGGLSIKEGEKRKTTQAVKATPHINLGKGATLVPSTVNRKAPPSQKRKEKPMGIKRVAGLA